MGRPHRRINVETARAPEKDLTPATILVVDDTPENIDLLQEILAPLYKVRAAANGTRALEIACSADRPDLILLDIMMPGMDGYQVIQNLKKDPYSHDIPVIFVTALGEEESEQRGFELGCQDYITKPLSAPLVRARVKTHLEQYRLRKAEQELLEKTLKGSLAMVVEMLSLLDPVSFEVARRMGELSERLAKKLGMDSPWILGLAAVLSQIGAVTIPEVVMVKVKRGAFLNTAEREMFNRIPEIGYKLMCNIPRMEQVAELVHYAQKNYNGSGFPVDETRGEEIPLGSRILRVAFDYLYLVPVKGTTEGAVNEMLSRTAWYDPDVLFALKDLLKEMKDEPRPEPVSMQLSELRPGQMLAEPVQSEDGRIFIQTGTVIGISHIEKLYNVARLTKLKEPILIQIT
jgi:response regulator RpfG family c-di-GMP phosphodiesterase